MDGKFRTTRTGRCLANGIYRFLAACSRVLGFPTGVALEVRYHLIQQRLERSLEPTSNVAVCVHLYYLDQWEMFASKLAAIDGLRFDLFITLPRPVRSFAGTILKDFPRAHIVIVPNRGRGTLPFIKVAQVLLKHEYDLVLKVHCRHAGTIGEGRTGLQSVLDSLLPDSPHALLGIVDRLKSPDVAIIGPSESYHRLDTCAYLARGRLTATIARRFGRTTARTVLHRPWEYGLFGGTTFWARLDALTPLLHYRVYDFEPELHWRRRLRGLPHLLEILFSLVPQLEGRQVLSIADGGISAVGNSSAALRQ